jgi:two-component system sensor histidine kinase PilS (NtrC family)
MVTTLLVIAVYVQAVSEALPSSTPLYAVIAATYVLTGAYALALRLVSHATLLVFGQVLGDLLMVTGLVYLMGDSRGGFLLLYPLAVLAGSVLLERRAGLLLSLLAVVMYAGLLVAVRTGWLPGYGLADVRLTSVRALGYSVFVTGVACATVALVGSYLAQSLKTVGERLERTAEAMEDLQELNRIIVDNIQSGLLMIDEIGRIVHLNAFGAGILGQSLESLRGRSVGDVFDAAELAGPALAARARGRLRARVDLAYVRPDGTRLDIGLSVSPLAQAKRDVPGGFLLAFQDLTEVKSLENAVRTNEKLAAVGEMAACLAHEIRNPLGSISGSAQMLMSEPGMSPEHERLLSIIRRESQRLSDSLNQFLLQTRPSSKLRGPIDIGSVVERALTLLQKDSELQGRHRVEFARTPAPLLCLADADAVTQVFWNLARNGIEAMPSGGTLRIDLSRQGQDAVLRFRDQGRGMAEEEIGRLFEPFRSRSPMGTGLGLSIVYRIVREHSGDILVRSVPGEGTEVEVRLPLASVEEAAGTAC